VSLEIRLRVKTPLVRSLARQAIPVVSREESLINVIKLMSVEGADYVLATEGGDRCRPIGVITTRHVVNALARGAPLNSPIAELELEKPVYVPPIADMFEAARLMCEHDVNYLVVVDERGCVIGLVTVKDIVKEVGIMETLCRIRL